MAKFLEFILENQNYAISVHNVQSVSSLHKIVKIPQTPNFVLGVAKFKGEITPIIDLKKLLKIHYVSLNKYRMAINVDIDNSFFSILVDDVLGVVDVKSHNFIHINVLNFNIVMLNK